MMNLLLMRHAKTEKTNATDFERNLVERGLHDTKLMCAVLKNGDLIPDLILSSSANRAKQTSEIIANEFKSKLKLTKSLYLASPEQITNLIEKNEKEIQTLLIVAHNPGIEYMIDYLFSNNLNLILPTTGLIHIQVFSDSWGMLVESQKSLKCVTNPKLLRAP